MCVQTNVFQSMMEGLPQAVLVTTADGMVLWCNAAARALCASTTNDNSEGVAGDAGDAPRTAFDTVSPEAREALTDMINRALGTPEPAFGLVPLHGCLARPWRKAPLARLECRTSGLGWPARCPAGVCRCHR